ncbi:MAG TPA: hypothetical protein PLX89_09920 [Verrucomicrobiota bacterium]|nr:hypothetical protein [Verrucomicrobiales bacterium]HRI13313.1 hypothetical protein [Verrucomicrobiota bacterium]
MGDKAEIGWTTPGEDGVKRHVVARHFGGKWLFFERPKRRGRDIEWEPLKEPPLSDWLDLLEAVERRANRDLIPPDQVAQLRQMIRDRYPEHRL